MSEVTLSKAVRSNLLNLQSTAVQMGKTQERLASGLKVNSALDNPTNFFTASALNSRASDLSRLLDSVSNAVQTIAAADKGISAINKLVESAQSTARQALQSAAPSFTLTGEEIAADSRASVTSEGAFSTLDDGDTLIVTDHDGNTQTFTFEATAADVDGLEFNSISELESLLRANDIKVTASDTGGDLTLTSTEDGGTFTVAGTAADSGDLDIDATPFRATNADFAAAVAANSTLTITSDGRDETITFGTGTNQVQNLEDLNEALKNLDGVSAKVVDGAVSIATKGGNPFTIAMTGTVNTAVNLTADTYEPTEGNPKRAELVSQYNDLLKQIDQLAKDAGFNGVNLLDGDNLQVTFNEDGTSKLDVAGTTFDASNLGLNEITDDQDWNTNGGINDTLDALKAASETLRTQAAKFGSNLSVVETRQDFTKNMINVLETGAANLTLADTNEEAANLLALQTRQQLSSTALSLASQADQNVLRLF